MASAPRSTLRRARAVHKWTPKLEDLLKEKPSTGEIVGQCGLCRQAITVRTSHKLNYSYGRLYAGCGSMEHGNFTWLEPASHLPVRWETCKCGQAMDCAVTDRRVVFRRWNKITGCQQMKQVNYAAIVDHAECVLCGIRLPAQEQPEPEEEAIELYNVSQGSTAVSAVSSEPSRPGLPITLTHGMWMARLREADARFCGSCFYMAIHDCRCCDIILVRPITVLRFLGRCAGILPLGEVSDPGTSNHNIVDPVQRELCRHGRERHHIGGLVGADR